MPDEPKILDMIMIPKDLAIAIDSELSAVAYVRPQSQKEDLLKMAWALRNIYEGRRDGKSKWERVP